MWSAVMGPNLRRQGRVAVGRCDLVEGGVQHGRIVLRDRDTTGNGTLDERLYALQDANWNVTAITNSSGTVQQRFAYSAYGQPTFLTAGFGSSTNTESWETLYAGYRWGVTSHLFHIRNRVYNATLGTWVQRDPLHYSDSDNLYAYARSNPLKATDSSGQLSDEVTCFCLIVSVADMFPYIWPPAGIALDAYDCLCNVLTGLNDPLNSPSLFWIATALDCLGPIGTSLLNCMQGALLGGIVGTLILPIGGSFFGALAGCAAGLGITLAGPGDVIGEIELFALQNLATHGDLLPTQQFCACERELGL